MCVLYGTAAVVFNKQNTPISRATVPSNPGMVQQQPQQQAVLVQQSQPGQQPLAMMVKVDPAAVSLPAGMAPGAAVQVVQQLPGHAQMGTFQSAHAPQGTAGSGGSVGSDGQPGQEQVSSLPQAFEKKLRRLEKNRESARGMYV